MSRYYTKSGKAKTIIITVITLCAVIVLGAVGINFLRADTETIGPGAFSVGGLNATGEYVERKDAIYTEDLITVDGLRIERDFESTVTFTVFFYDSDKAFIEATESITKLTSSDVPENAEYCRIMITPERPADLEADEDFEIGYFARRSYAKELTITVNK